LREECNHGDVVRREMRSSGSESYEQSGHVGLGEAMELINSLVLCNEKKFYTLL